eukprot:4302791-Amphidinium_carterae.1
MAGFGQWTSWLRGAYCPWQPALLLAGALFFLSCSESPKSLDEASGQAELDRGLCEGWSSYKGCGGGTLFTKGPLTQELSIQKVSVQRVLWALVHKTSILQNGSN